MKNKLLIYLRLSRFHSGASESLLLLVGALIMGQREIIPLVVLFFIGLLYHICGFVLNDYADIEVDKKSADLTKKPLVSGAVPKEHALIFAISAGVGTYILALIFFFSIFTFFLLTMAILLGGIYDFYGKKILGVSDFIIAGSLAFIFLFGASTSSMYLTTIVYLIGLAIFFGIVFANAIEGGLKDVDHDYLSGAKTLATALGVKVRDGCILYTNQFKAFAYWVVAMCFGFGLLISFQPEINLWRYDYLKPGVVIFFLVVIILAIYKLLHLQLFDRKKIKRLYAVINSAAGVVLLLMVYPLIGGLVITLILLVLPITWYIVFNIILYGKPLQPEV